jgi:hypothetical protein
VLVMLCFPPLRPYPRFMASMSSMVMGPRGLHPSVE